VGPATTSVALPPQALSSTTIRIAKKKYLTRTGKLQRIKNIRIILPDFVEEDGRRGNDLGENIYKNHGFWPALNCPLKQMENLHLHCSQ
jgi:hypothetical protein